MSTYRFSIYNSFREGGLTPNGGKPYVSVGKGEEFVCQFSLEVLNNTGVIHLDDSTKISEEEKEEIFRDFCVFVVKRRFE